MLKDAHFYSILVIFDIIINIINFKCHFKWLRLLLQILGNKLCRSLILIIFGFIEILTIDTLGIIYLPANKKIVIHSGLAYNNYILGVRPLEPNSSP